MAARQFTLEYLIKVVGGGVAGAQIGQVNNQLKAAGPIAQNTAKGFTALETSSRKASTAVTQTTGHLKGVAFGLIGLTSAGVEAVGMWGMYQDTAKRTEEAQAKVTEALAKYGEGSTEANKATQELTKSQRFQSMVTRNLILSMFDMVPFTLLLVNGIREQIILTKQLREAQVANAAANAAAATAERARIASQLALVGSTNTLIGSHFRLTPSLIANAAATGGITTANIAFTGSTVAASTAATRFGGVITTLLTRLGPIAAILAAIGVAAVAFSKNWLGIRDAVNTAGAAIGKAVPQLKPLLDILSKVGLTIDAIVEMRFGDIGAIWSGEVQKMNAAKLDEEAIKRIEEFDTSAKKLFHTLAMADKGERKDLFSAIGIKGGAAKRFKDTLKEMESVFTRLEGFGQALGLLRMQSKFEKFFDFPDSLSKKIAFTWEDRFRKMFDQTNFKPFDILADTLEANADKGSDKISRAIAFTVLDNQEIITMLRSIGMDPVADELQAMIDEVAGLMTVTPGGGGTQFKPDQPLTEEEFAKVAGDARRRHDEEMKKRAEQQKVGENFVAGIVTGFKNAFTTANLGTAAETLKNTLLAPILDRVFWTSAGATIIGFLTEGWGTAAAAQISAGINALTTAILQRDWWTSVGATILGFIGEGFMLMQQIQASLAMALATNILDIEFWKSTGATVAGFIFEGFTLLGSLQTSLAQFVANIATAILQMDFWKSTGATIAGFIVEGFNLFAAVGTGLAQFISNIATALLDIEFFKSVGATIAGFIVEGLNGLAIAGEAISEFINNIMDAIVEIVPNLTSVFTDIVNAFIDGIVGAIGAIADVGTRIFNPIADKVAEAAAGTDLESSALEDFIEGDSTTKKDKPLLDRFLGSFLPISLLPKGGGNLIPSEPPSTSGPSDPFNKRGLNQLRISTGEDKDKEEETVNVWQVILQEAMKTVLAIEIAFKTMMINLATEFTNISTAWTLSMQTILVAAQLNTALLSFAFVNAATIINIAFTALSIAINQQFILIGQTAVAVAQLMLQGFTILVTTLNTFFTTLSVAVIQQFVLMGQTAIVAAQAILTAWAAVFTNVSAGMSGLANTWSAVCNSFMNNASAAGNGIRNNLESAMSDVEGTMSDLASHWSSMCNSMIANAKSAASGITSALNKIPRRINVTVHVGVSGPGVRFLARGFHGVVNTPTLMMVGEAGPERVDVSKTGAPATGLSIDRSMNLTPSLPGGSIPAPAGGDTHVQVFLDGEQVKGRVVKMIVKNQGGYK